MNKCEIIMLALTCAAAMSVCSCKDAAKERQKSVSGSQAQAGRNGPQAGGNVLPADPTAQGNSVGATSYRTADLVGTWACDNSVIILSTDGRYESYVNGQPTQAGTWSVSRDKLTFTDAQGQQETDTIESLSADAVTVTLDDGRKTIWKKTNWRPGANGQAPVAPSLTGTWTAANGAKIVFSQDGKFASYAQGRLVSQGLFEIRGQKLVLGHPNGATETYTIQMGENGFTATDEMGNSLNYSRSGQ